MALYSLNGNYPQPLPHRIKLSNGSTRTDVSTFLDWEIADAGYIAVENPPQINSNQILEWDMDNLSWVVRDKDMETQWTAIRNQRDDMIARLSWRYERYYRLERLGLPQKDDINILDKYVQDLTDIPQKQNDPFNIVWPILKDDSYMKWVYANTHVPIII